MPAVFIHGVPDTARLWSDLLARLSRRDVVTLGLPGFQTPLPEHFDSSKESYVAWIIEQLERIGTAVDLVAHDWGGASLVEEHSVRRRHRRSRIRLARLRQAVADPRGG